VSGSGREPPDPFRPARWVELVAHARLRVVGHSPVRLDAADLRRRAARQVGRSVDPPDPGLDVLLADAATAELTDLGRLAVRAQLLRRIVNAEQLAERVAQCPELEDVVTPRPVVIVGLPRTGTTLLHGLLACDPAAFAPRFWQLQRPARPSSSRFDLGVRYVRAALMVSAAKAMLPTLRGIHPLAARQPEECVFLFRDVATHAVPFPAFGYLRWLQGEGASAMDYSAYRRHLQVLLTSRPGRRPMLKSPFHLGHLDQLLTVLPDVLIVHTHREPTIALASWCSFAATVGRGTVSSLDVRELGWSWLQFWAHAAERALAVRGAADARRFHDVQYAELVADPLREVRHVYAAAGLDFTREARQRMERWLERHHDRQGASRHRYRLEQFGLDTATVEARFRAYRSL
jgi:Sulfotransferase family